MRTPKWCPLLVELPHEVADRPLRLPTSVHPPPLVLANPCPSRALSFLRVLLPHGKSSLQCFPKQTLDDPASPLWHKLHDDCQKRRGDGHIGNCVQRGGETDKDGGGAPPGTNEMEWSFHCTWELLTELHLLQALPGIYLITACTWTGILLNNSCRNSCSTREPASCCQP